MMSTSNVIHWTCILKYINTFFIQQRRISLLFFSHVSSKYWSYINTTDQKDLYFKSELLSVLKDFEFCLNLFFLWFMILMISWFVTGLIESKKIMWHVKYVKHKRSKSQECTTLTSSMLSMTHVKHVEHDILRMYQKIYKHVLYSAEKNFFIFLLLCFF